MKTLLGIINYGMGNIGSVYNALQFLGYNVFVDERPAVLRRARALIFPGVGSFREAMSNLRQRGLDHYIGEEIASGKPFLGICLGMQLLLSRGYEQGEERGLDIIPGEVTLLRPGPGYKVPHVGWNQIHFNRVSAHHPLFANIAEGTYQYFVHSYAARPANCRNVLIHTDYGVDFVAGLKQGNTYGLQFHPERSGREGLKILHNFGGLVYGTDSSS